MASPRDSSAQDAYQPHYHELALLGMDAEGVAEEVDERELGENFDQHEEDMEDKLRVLDSFVLYTEQGEMVPPSALDNQPADGGPKPRYFAFGTVLPNLKEDCRQKLVTLDAHYKGHPPLCVPRHYSATADAYSRRAAGAGASSEIPGPGSGDWAAAALGTKRKANDDGFGGEKRLRPSAPEGDEAGSGSSAGRGAGSGGGRSQRGENVGAVMRRHGWDGLLLHYNAGGPRTQPIEFEALGGTVGAIAGGESGGGGSSSGSGGDGGNDGEQVEKNIIPPLDRATLVKGTKVDTFCTRTHIWYPAKVVAVGKERKDGQALRIHFAGWNANFDEWIDRDSYRLAAAGSHTGATTLVNPAAAAAAARRAAMEQGSTTSCIRVTERRGKRLRIEVQDWCVDFSSPSEPALWLISPHAWYLIAGGPWWDHVDPTPAYEPVFRDMSRQFRVATLTLRALYQHAKTTLAAAARRVVSWSGGAITMEDIEECHAFITKTLAGAPPVSLRPGGQDDSSPGPEIDASKTILAQQVAAAGARWEASGRPPKEERAAARRAAEGENAAQRDYNPTMRGPERRAMKEQARAEALRLLEMQGMRPEEAAAAAAAAANPAAAPRLPAAARQAAAGGSAAGGGGASREGRTEEEKLLLQQLRRYPIPDEQHWEEQARLGTAENSTNLNKPFPCENAPAPLAARITADGVSRAESQPPLPLSCFGDAMAAWSCLQLYGELLRLPSFDLHCLLEALAPGSSALTTRGGGGSGDSTDMGSSARASVDVAGALMVPSGHEWPGTTEQRGLLARIHMGLLDFLAWDAVRSGGPSVRSVATAAAAANGGFPDRAAAYWHKLFFGLDLAEREAAEKARDAALKAQKQAASGPRGRKKQQGAAAAAGQPAEEEEEELDTGLETTVQGQRGSWGLLRSTTAGWVEMSRLILMHKEGVLKREHATGEDGGGGSHSGGGSAGGGRDSPASGLGGTSVDGGGGLADSGALLAVHLDPVGECAGILLSLIAAAEAEPAKAAAAAAAAAAVAAAAAGVVPWEGGAAAADAQAKAAAAMEADASAAICGALNFVTERLREGWYDGFCDKDARLARERALLPMVSTTAEPVGKSAAALAGAATAAVPMANGGSEAVPMDVDGGEEKGVPKVELSSSGRARVVAAGEAVSNGIAKAAENGVKAEMTPPAKPLAAAAAPVKAEEGVINGGGGAATAASSRGAAAAPNTKLEEGAGEKAPALHVKEEGAGAELPTLSADDGASFGRGHEGLAADVVVQLAEFGRRESPAALERAMAMAEQFDAIYAEKVLAPLTREGDLAASELATASAADLESLPLDWEDWAVVVAVATTRDYEDWPAKVKLRLLSWLCDEALSTETMRELMERAQNARAAVDRRDREIKTQARSHIKGLEDGGVMGEDYIAQSSGGFGKGKAATGAFGEFSTEAELVQQMMAAEDSTMRSQRELCKLVVRLEPLGEDRAWRRYWVFRSGAATPGHDGDSEGCYRDDFDESDEKDEAGEEWLNLPLDAGAVFIEDGPRWVRLTTRGQILELYAWLDRRGTRERALKVLLREHLSELGASDARIAAADAAQLALFAAMAVAEESHRGRERERKEREQARATLEALAFRPEVQRKVLASTCGDLKVNLKLMVGEHAAAADAAPYNRGPVVTGCRARLGAHGLGLSLVQRLGAVSVAGFTAAQPNPAKDAGVLPGDLLLAVNRCVAEFPGQLAEAMKRSGATTETDRALRLRLGRELPLLAAGGDGEVIAGCSDQARELAPGALLQGMLLVAESTLNHPFMVAGGLVGEERAGWRAAVLDAFPVAGLPLEDSVTGAPPLTVAVDCVRALAPRLLQLEEALARRDTVLRAGWAALPVPADDGQGPDGRRNLVAVCGLGQRRKWRRFVEQARTVGQLLVAWGTLDAAIKWSVVRDVAAELTREEFLALLPPARRNPIPQAQDLVIYYGEGHHVAVAAERKRGIFPTRPRIIGNGGSADAAGGAATAAVATGSDAATSAAAAAASTSARSRGAYPEDYVLEGGGERCVVECRVLSVEYETGGPLADGRADWRDAGEARRVARRWGASPTPFARIELEVLPKGYAGPDGNPTPTEKLGLRPCCEPRAKLCRLLRRVIREIRHLPIAEAFVDAVDPRTNPGYHETVPTPMDLRTLSDNCIAARYGSPAEFAVHLRLIATNCQLYCRDRFPDLPPQAEALVKAGIAALLAEPLASHLRAAEAEANELEQFWQDKMRAAIESARKRSGEVAAAQVAASLGIPMAAAGGTAGSAVPAMKVRPKTARLAREVFFDKMVPTVYGEEPLIPAPTPAAALDANSKTDGSGGASSGGDGANSGGCGGTGSGKIANGGGASSGSGSGGGGSDAAAMTGVGLGPDPVPGTRFVVCMRLAKDFPAFLVQRSEYISSVSRKWRMEEPVRGYIVDPRRDEARRCTGSLVGLRPQHPSCMVPWRCLKVEWEDADAGTVDADGASFTNPWEVEPVAPPSTPNGGGDGSGRGSKKRARMPKGAAAAATADS